jgi:hypothetical protein
MEDVFDQVMVAARSNIAIPLSFVGQPLVMLIYILGSTFILLWITSKVDEGYLKSEKEAKDMY